MICDDSAVIRGAIARALEADPTIRVVARAANGRDAVESLRRAPVDVIVLDIEMPVLDGIAALPLLLAVDPGVRIVMASTLTTRGADIALRALRLGAADYIPKPSAIGPLGDALFRDELVAKVKGLARLRRAAAGGAAAGGGAPRAGTGCPPAPASRPPPARTPHLLAIGSSTGGPQALLALVAGLGRDVGVPVAITQHMPPAFTAMLATHITALGGLPCAEAEDQAPLLPGRIYLAPGNRHLLIEAGPTGSLRTRLSDAPPVNYCRPAVDPMLESAAVAAQGRVLVAMLTGMGHDGLAGTTAVIAAGGTAVAQDEATSVVWGMPGAIAQAGLCHAVLPLPRLAPRLLELLRSGRT
ncbi:MAG: chemotaxis response regulator protein-glutamate methylesterase [Proteobacteria bacterium]|nr:chemotaxis response regulator protein-glutamate methylesterase [Pseudomonadota bacterium]